MSPAPPPTAASRPTTGLSSAPVAVESKPRPAASSTSSTAAAAAPAWREILERAAPNPRDAALLSHFTPRSIEASSMTLVGREDDPSATYLRGNVELVRATVSRLVGRPIDVRVEFEGVAAVRTPPQARAQVTAEIREHPIVKLASELFDAAIVDVSPLRREEAATTDDALAAQAPDAVALPRTTTTELPEGDED
ncbi:MAG: hypothetical protein JNM94_02015 [Phycisphaerae bacterium]|nr:hypothetical protein [Phycisphaerae bacterium]